MKSAIYDSLSALNRSMEQFLDSLRTLQELDIVAPDFAESRRLSAELMRAEINHRATLKLTEVEQREAAQFEKLRVESEKH